MNISLSELYEFSNRLESFCAHRQENEDSIYRISLAGKLIKICFVNGTDCTFFSRSLCHLNTVGSLSSLSDLKIYIYEYKNSNAMFSKVPWNWKDTDPYGNIVSVNNLEIYFAHYQANSSTFRFIDFERNRAFMWIKEIAYLPNWERSFPLRKFLYLWFRQFGFLFLHASALGTPQGGVLLFGRGGSGKSTTALSCLNSDLLFGGDDFVMVHPSSKQVYCLYNGIKLSNENWNRFDHYKPFLTDSSNSSDNKKQFFVYEHFPQKVIESFPIKAILLPKFIAREKISLVSVSAPVALEALAPSTLGIIRCESTDLSNTAKLMRSILSLLSLIKMSDFSELTHLSALTRSLPCFRLETGINLTAIPKKISELLVTLID